MERVPASKKLRKGMEELLEGIDSREFFVGEIMKMGRAIVLQELSEQGVVEF
ncbi:MAG: hypothetical protein ACE5I8_09400 [Thermodesulfobacteriota bacterium]